MKIKDISEGQVVPFVKKKTEQEKFADAFEKQNNHTHRHGVGRIECEYCGDVNCDFDCDESQSGGFNNNTLKENSTTSGSVASVSMPLKVGTIKRNPNVGKGIYGSTKTGNLLTGKSSKKKFANSISEGKELGVNHLASLIRSYIVATNKEHSSYMSRGSDKKNDWYKVRNTLEKDINRVKKEITKYYGWMQDDEGDKLKDGIGSYDWSDIAPIEIARMWISSQDPRLLKKHGISLYKFPVQEGELNEEDIIVKPGQKSTRRTGLINPSQDENLKDHELLQNIITNAESIIKVLNSKGKKQSLPDWVKLGINKANVLLGRINSDMITRYDADVDEGVLGAIAGGTIGAAATKSAKGATTGAKIGNEIQDSLKESGSNLIIELNPPKPKLMKAFKKSKGAGFIAVEDGDIGFGMLKDGYSVDHSTIASENGIDEGDELFRGFYNLETDTFFIEVWSEEDWTPNKIKKITPSIIKNINKHKRFLNLSGNNYVINFYDDTHDNTNITVKNGVPNITEMGVIAGGGAMEGKKVDRMVKHIAKSERDSGKSKKEAENIAWATANKRGYLDNKNKK